MCTKKFTMAACLFLAFLLCQPHTTLAIRSFYHKDTKLPSMGVVDFDMLLGSLPRGPIPPSAPSNRENPAPFSGGGD
ncbi:hypothetical protein SDJN03_01274, partial [Cucurbita argyrosperma subsp. sororia]